ncbi:MAG TPA: Rne/Rng family ribonuclease, partial [Myxococcales bacterium]|nr:Rne/Rng family ribonuclease [Myxococcales bacterium]
MSNILVINASGQETRVALIEQGTISEYYLERKNEKGIVGNIYKGRVVRVLPGMQAAFVDIGLDKAAFLYVGDIVSDPTFPGFSEEMDIKAGSVEGDPLDAEDLPEPSEESLPQAAEPPGEPSAAEAAATSSASGSGPSDAAPGIALAQVSDSSAGESGSALLPPLAAAAEPTRAIQPPPPPEPELERDAIAQGPESIGSAQGESGPARGPEAEPVPVEAAAGAQTAEPAEVLELHPEDVIEEDDDDDLDGDEEELDEADAAHAAAEEAMAAEQAGAEASQSQADASAQPGAPASPPDAAAAGTPQAADAGARGLPAEQRPVAREGRRGRRRGGRGRRRGGEGGPRPAGEQPKPERRAEAKPWQGPPERRGADKRNGNGHKRAQIQDLLKEGDEVLVQAVKDPIGTKGARITCHISLPGRHLVFMPTVDHVGISRRIENEKERRRLRDLVDRYRPPGTGFIVRTVAENEPSEKLTADIKFLLGLWNEVGKKRESMKAPACVHPDLDLILRSIRDLFSDEVEKLVIDDRAEYERTRAFVEQAAPELKERIELYGGEEPIFDEYGIEQELIRAQNRKVWLKSGGYIIIDQTEALVAIDVNSGRYVGKKGAGASLEDTITKINCEAAKEIVYQLRLRNIGGIIIIDFIDMDKGGNREKVFKTLQDALAADRAKTNVLKISDIGLVEMTRKRVRESIGRLTTEA